MTLGRHILIAGLLLVPLYAGNNTAVAQTAPKSSEPNPVESPSTQTHSTELRKEPEADRGIATVSEPAEPTSINSQTNNKISKK